MIIKRIKYFTKAFWDEKEKSPRIFKRDKYKNYIDNINNDDNISDFLSDGDKAEQSGAVRNYKIDDIYHQSNYNNYRIESEDFIDEYDSPTYTSQEIFDNYKKAMTRKRDYIYYGLPYHLDSENGFDALKDPDSIGMIIGKQDKSTGIFHPSHFAPTNIKNGVKLAEMSKDSQTPILYTVPRDLSDQLVKSGHFRYGSIPMIFQGEIMEKDLVGNEAFNNIKDKKSVLKQLAKEFPRYSELIERINPDEIFKITKFPKEKENLFWKKLRFVGNKIILNNNFKDIISSNKRGKFALQDLISDKSINKLKILK